MGNFKAALDVTRNGDSQFPSTVPGHIQDSIAKSAWTRKWGRDVDRHRALGLPGNTWKV